uniref:NADH dehydrogenase subunit 6 n=1 Tax=Chaetodipus penicillatus TaxID=38672 RepID=UPI00226D09A0|nr:NADH dehydrogenase subunit 6 [Chaetodipus penicillatus]UZH94564.1 NADH dehydrogenase subunit 6 [Chaetodipus penicillatus]
MTILLILMMVLLVLGFIGVSVKPSPIFAGAGLIISGAVGCGVLVVSGSSYMGLMVFLIYLGGMMVVFGYTTAMATDAYPETWSSNLWLWFILLSGILLEVVLVITVLHFDGLIDVVALYNSGNFLGFGDDDVLLVRVDSMGNAAIYSYGNWIMVVGGWTLFMAVYIIIEITRGI